MIGAECARCGRSFAPDERHTKIDWNWQPPEDRDEAVGNGGHLCYDCSTDFREWLDSDPDHDRLRTDGGTTTRTPWTGDRCDDCDEPVTDGDDYCPGCGRRRGPADLPGEPRDRAVAAAAAGVAGWVGFWLGVVQVPESVLTVERVIPAPKGAMFLTTLGLCLALWYARTQWQAAEDGGER